MQKNNDVINSLKGIAILGIIFVHFSPKFPMGCLAPYAQYGARGVQLLLIINGFLTCGSLERLYKTGGRLSEWYLKKVIRIIPQYWIATGIWLLAFGTGYQYWLGPHKSISVINILANFFCVHGFYPYYINSINLNWFVADLAIWYIIAPLIYRYLNNLKKVIITALLYIGIINTIMNCVAEYYLNMGNSVLGAYYEILCFPSCLTYIFLGIVVYWLRKHIVKMPSSVCCIGSWVMILLLFFTIIIFNEVGLFEYILSWGILWFVILFLQSYHPWMIFDNFFLSFIGKHSYGIYLFHWTIINLVERYLTNWGMHFSTRGNVILFVAVLITATLIAIIMERSLQNPIELWFEKWRSSHCEKEK